MDDKKIIMYVISWRQDYTNWPSQEWLDEASSVVIENKLENQEFDQAREVIDRIRSL